jgi:post-segregation antitoxin (ccd killing protein)
MRMARLNVYLPDELACKAREAKLNISALTQAAVEGALQKNAWSEWLAEVRKHGPTGITHEEIMKVMDEVHDEMWGEDDKPENYRRLG